MERRQYEICGERNSRTMYMEWQGRSRHPVADSYHLRRPRSRSPVSHRRQLAVARCRGYSFQAPSRPCNYGSPESRGHYSRPADRSSDHYDRRHRSPPSKRPRLEPREDSRRRETWPAHRPSRPSSVVTIVKRAATKASAPEPSVTFPELWGTYMTAAMERQLDQWREESRQVQASDPGSSRGHAVSGGSSRASSGRTLDGPLRQSPRPAQRRAGSHRSHDGQRRESSYTGSWRGGYKRSFDVVQDECPCPAKVFINSDHPRFSRY